MVFLTLAALAAFGQEAPVQAAPPESIAAIRRTLDNYLSDYQTARFRDVRIVTLPSNTYVKLAACGTLNARSPEGGYVGWTRFVVLNDSVEAEQDSLGRRAVREWCDNPSVVTVAPDITAAVSP